MSATQHLAGIKIVPIHADNGYDECPVCLHCQSQVCDSCTDADKFKLDPDSLRMNTFGPLEAVTND